eukprot:CAMPEP_0116919334 /NCGR_PEP_ID=MMETSP0467-20121206/20320_1 /TAXON_ID=283647 /ORGANISM="Mesodinium pulex, Strain SPMC105" /LENGTH=93 /DNA_ID=CAMNT_0004596885 /DNA_START=975 /DNA_END=1256 /DNA_ORIENTATION=+
MELEAELIDMEKQMRILANRNSDFSDLRREIDNKRLELQSLEDDLDQCERRLNMLDDKLSGQTVLEKRRLERGYEAEKDVAKMKNDYSKLLVD